MSHEVGVTEVGVTEVGVTEVGVTEVGVTEVGVTEVGVTEVGVTEVGVTENGDLARHARTYMYSIQQRFRKNLLFSKLLPNPNFLRIPGAGTRAPPSSTCKRSRRLCL